MQVGVRIKLYFALFFGRAIAVPWVEVQSEVTAWVRGNLVKVVFLEIETEGKYPDQLTGQSKTALPVGHQFVPEVG